MLLRWFRTVDPHGLKTEWRLQRFVESDDLNGKWDDIPYVECKDFEEDTYLIDRDAI